MRIAGLIRQLKAIRDDLRLWHIHPRNLPCKAYFRLAHRLQVLRQLVPIRFAKLAFEALSICQNIIQNALFLRIPLQSQCTACCIIRDEQALEQPPRAVLRWKGRAIAIKCQRMAVQRATSARHVTDFDAWKPRGGTNLPRDDLIG